MYIDILVQTDFYKPMIYFVYRFVLYGHTVFILFVQVLKNINSFFLNVDSLEVLKNSMEPLSNQKC